ncbi:EamA family transporter, partial [Streptomyces alkaliphilus]
MSASGCSASQRRREAAIASRWSANCSRFRGLERLPASTVSFLALVGPLVAAVLGWVVLGEAFTVRQLLGGLLIAGAILLTQLVT